MPSSYNNVIKGKEISEKKLISLPSIEEKIYKKQIEKIESSNFNLDLDGEKISKIMEKAKKDGEDLIESYRKEGEKLIVSAREEIETLKEEAKEEGYQVGYKDGYKDGYAYGDDEVRKENEALIEETKKIRDTANEYLKTCHIESRDYIKSTEVEIINMILEVSRKVISTEISQNKEAVASLLETAILKCVGKEQVVLRLSPKNASIAKTEKERFIPLVDENCKILILADGEVDDETFKIENPSGFVDASIEIQLNTILKDLLGDN